jgi:hypothetical protein
MSKEIKVTGCKDCPFAINLKAFNHGYWCAGDGGEYLKEIQEVNNSPIIRDNCPLKTESIIVTL